MQRRDIIAMLLWPLMCAVSAHAQQVEIHWTPKASMPGSLYAFDAVTIGRAIYAVGRRGAGKAITDTPTDSIRIQSNGRRGKG